jgi:hypothetical protein
VPPEAPRQGRKSALLICIGSNIEDRDLKAEAETHRLAELLGAGTSGFKTRVLIEPDAQELSGALNLFTLTDSDPNDTVLIHCNSAFDFNEGTLAASGNSSSGRDVGRALAGRMPVIRFLLSMASIEAMAPATVSSWPSAVPQKLSARPSG